MRPDLKWQTEAACRGMETALFFPAPGQIVPAEVTAVCATCPVRAQCSTHAVRFGEYGYWGGSSSQQRRRVRSRHTITATRLTVQTAITNPDLSTKPAEVRRRANRRRNAEQTDRRQNGDSETR